MNTVWNSFFHPSPAAKPEGAPLPKPGAGLRLTANAIGFAYNAAERGQTFNHPFRPALGPRGVTLARGLVEFLEPRIGRVPISGDAQTRPPVLALDAAQANARGESWVCAELVLNDLGGLAEGTFPQIVHTGAPVSRALLLARAPLVLIVWRERRPWRAVPFAFFNLRHARIVPPAGQGVVRHLFY